MRRNLAGIAGVMVVASAFGAVAFAADQALSPAQIALFETDHLKEIGRPVRLDYTFLHRGGPEGDFADTVVADIRAVHPDGSKDVWIDFLSGDRRVEMPPAMGFSANPLLVLFLEHDLKEMRLATGGSVEYFRNRISEAFADRAELRPVEVTLDGKTLKATEVAVAPFRGDPHLTKFPGLAGKTYRFVLSDAVPGGIYQMSTTPAPSGDASGVFEERLTYVGEHEGAQ